MAQRWIVHTAAAGVEEPRVGLRLHADQDSGRHGGAAVDGHGWVHPGVLGDQG